MPATLLLPVEADNVEDEEEEALACSDDEKDTESLLLSLLKGLRCLRLHRPGVPLTDGRPCRYAVLTVDAACFRCSLMSR